MILTNPYGPDDMDRALEEALTLGLGEQVARMLKLRDRVLTHDNHRWSNHFLSDAERVSAARARIPPLT